MNIGSISLPVGEKAYLDDEQQFIIADEYLTRNGIKQYLQLNTIYTFR